MGIYRYSTPTQSGPYTVAVPAPDKPAAVRMVTAIMLRNHVWAPFPTIHTLTEEGA